VDIQIQQPTFLKVLSYLQSISDKKSTMPILSYFLMEATQDEGLKFFATDLNVGLTVKTEAKVLNKGAILLPSKKLFSIVHELPEKMVHVKTSQKEGWCNITCEKSRFNLPYLESSSFPKVPEFPEGFSNTLPSEIILSILEKTLFAAANEETRYNLNCIFMKKFPEEGSTRIVATDGHRLVQMDLSSLKDLALDEAIMIPKKGMMELKRVLSDAKVSLVGFEVKDKNVYFQMENVGMVVRLMDGDYPDYQQVIPKTRGRLIHINRWDLITGLRRVSRIANDMDEGAKFAFRDDGLTLKMGDANTGIAQETIETSYKGDPITFAFNYRYCLDILGALEEEEVEIELLDEDNPGIFRGKGNKEVFYLIMPMRIEEEENE
jgi:DNA polymerase-3 subunit beta